MNEFIVTGRDGREIERVEASDATQALDTFCANHPDDAFGVQRGGLMVDSGTRGDLSASVLTDAGRINADLASL